MLIALVPVIRGFINPAIVSFQKELRFHQETWLRVAVTVVDSLVAIGVVAWQRTPAGMVYGLIAGVLVEVVISHFLTPKPRLQFNPKHFKKIIHSGKWITLSGILAYLSNKGSDIAVGKFLSTTELGLFQMAYRLAVIPIEELHEITNRVFFPLYVKIGEDRQRLRSALIKNTTVIFSLTVLFSLIIVTLTQPIVNLILGDQWLEVVPLIRTMAILPIIIASGAFTNPLFLAVKKQHYLTITVAIQFASFAIIIVPLMYTFSVLGAIYALALSMLISLPIRLYFTYNILSPHDS
jgi:O-antigen/teichoic acid export membrane protein